MASAIGVAEAYAADLLDGEARRHMRDRLRSKQNVWSFIHECETFTTFIRLGLTAIPLFFRNGASVDVELHWNGWVIPVQCKSKQPGAGSAFKEDVSTRLLASIARDLKFAGRRCAIRIKPATAEDFSLDDIDVLRQAARYLPERTDGDRLEYSHGRLFALASLPLSQDSIPNELDVALSRFGCHIGLAVSEPSGPSSEQLIQAVVGVDANPNDEEQKAAAAFLTALSRAAHQLDGGPPGIAAIHYFNTRPVWQGTEDAPPWMVHPLNEAFANHQSLAGVIVSVEPYLIAPGKTDSMRSRWIRRDELPSGFPDMRFGASRRDDAK
jgi:hypothetical protein